MRRDQNRSATTLVHSKEPVPSAPVSQHQEDLSDHDCETPIVATSVIGFPEGGAREYALFEVLLSKI